MFEFAVVAAFGFACIEVEPEAEPEVAPPAAPEAPVCVAFTEFAAALTSATEDGSLRPRRLCCCGASPPPLDGCEVLMMRMLTATLTLPCVHDRSNVPSGWRLRCAELISFSRP